MHDDDDDKARITLGDKEVATLSFLPLVSEAVSVEFRVPLEPDVTRLLCFECGDAGPTLCPECSVYAVTEAVLVTTTKGESTIGGVTPPTVAKECIGRKCHWCGWRGPCEGH